MSFFKQVTNGTMADYGTRYGFTFSPFFSLQRGYQLIVMP